MQSLLRLRDLQKLKSERQRAQFHRYKADPVGFIRNVLKSDPWPVQEEIVRSVFENPATVVPACFGSGKSYIAARIAMAWVATDPEAACVTTATTVNQVEKILWGEIRKAWVPELPGKLLPKAADWEISPYNWARGISVADPVNMQGFHEGRVLVIVDEAAGVEANIFDAIQGLVAGGDSAILLIGNPIETSGPFYEASSNPRYNHIPISAFDTPNLTAPVGDIPYPKLVTREWVEDRRIEWGEDDPRWISKVLGQFPSVGTRIVIPLDWFDRTPTLEVPFGPHDKAQMGLDIARFGNDDSALCIRKGSQILHLERIHGASGPEVGGWAANRAREFGVTTIWGDSGGLGGPVLDFMREAGLHVIDVNAGSKTHQPEEFVMLRDELWWGLRDRFRDQSVSFHPDCADTEKRILRGQVSALFYDYDIRGRIKIESKEQAKKRGVTSPDLADAACLSFYTGAGLAGQFIEHVLVNESQRSVGLENIQRVEHFQSTGFPHGPQEPAHGQVDGAVVVVDTLPANLHLPTLTREG